MTQTKDKDLMPCPFCGVKCNYVDDLDTKGREGWDSEAFIHPDNECKILSGYFISPFLWEAWNTRHHPEQPSGKGDMPDEIYAYKVKTFRGDGFGNWYDEDVSGEGEENQSIKYIRHDLYAPAQVDDIDTRQAAEFGIFDAVSSNEETDEKRVMGLMARALETYCVGRASSDTEYAREALREYEKLGGVK